MRKSLSKWSKEVKKEMIDRNMTIKDVADEIGKSYVYTSTIISGRIYSPGIVSQISDLLDIPTPAYFDD